MSETSGASCHPEVSCIDTRAKRLHPVTLKMIILKSRPWTIAGLGMGGKYGASAYDVFGCPGSAAPARIKHARRPSLRDKAAVSRPRQAA